MKRISIKLGYWAAMICTATFVIWTVCFVAIFKVNPIFQWTNLADYVRYAENYNQGFKYLAQSAMLLFAPAFLIILHSINEYAPEDKKILSKISISFGTIFAACISIHYFVQISSVRLSIVKGQIAGLEQFIQANPISGIAGINMVGWTLFFSLASLFIAPIFTGNRLNKVIKNTLIINGIICILGGIGFVLDNIIIIFLTMNLGMGAATLTATIALLIFFKRLSANNLKNL